MATVNLGSVVGPQGETGPAGPSIIVTIPCTVEQDSNEFIYTPEDETLTWEDIIDYLDSGKIIYYQGTLDDSTTPTSGGKVAQHMHLTLPIVQYVKFASEDGGEIYYDYDLWGYDYSTFRYEVHLEDITDRAIIDPTK